MLDTHLIYEAYNLNAKPLISRFELKELGDGFVIMDRSKRAPYNVIARFDRDEAEAAQKRFEYLCKPLTGTAISQGFNKLKQELQKESPEDFELGKFPDHKIFHWLSEAKFAGPFMQIGNQWVVGRINQPKWSIGLGEEETHEFLFSNRMSQYVFESIKDTSINRHQLATQIKDIPLIKRLATQEVIDENMIYDMVRILQEFREPNIIQKKLGWIFQDAFNNAGAYSTIRQYTNSGRVWIDPVTTENETVHGMFLSLWFPRTELIPTVERNIGDILKQQGFVFKHIIWDGDEYIDPSQKHVAAAKQKRPAPNWDDIKYAPA